MTSILPTSLRGRLRQRMQQWLARQVPAASQCTLHRGNIFILPTAQGMLFLAGALLIFVTAINYAISLAFALAFLMVSLFIVSILHTFRNLQGLSLRAVGHDEAFAGESARVRVALAPGAGRRHEAIRLGFNGVATAPQQIRVDSRITVDVPLPVSRRGRHRAPRLRIDSSFPLGLCRAWALPDLQQTVLVYPAPRPCRWQGHATGRPRQSGRRRGEGDDDFQGLRAYQAGDPINRIAWKQYARSAELQVKQFQAMGGSQLMLSWHQLAGYPAETRLEMLCYLVLEAMHQGQACGLEMPGLRIDPDLGACHRKRLLETLASWQ